MNSNCQELKSPYRVLIVDDDIALSDAYERIIRHAGGKPMVSGNGQEAIEVLKKQQVDIMLVDLRMPVMSGIELLEWMHTRAYDPIVVILSNYDNPREIKRAYELGAERYVLKAWATPNDLIRMLNETLETKSCETSREHKDS